MPCTKEEKIFCVTTHLEIKSFKTVQVKFCRKFNLNNYPQKSQIYHWVHKFQATGLINNLDKKAENPRSSRKLTVKCPDNVEAVRDSVERSLKKSLRRHSQELGYSCHHCKKSYIIQIKHKLTPADMEKRLVMCWWFKNKIEEDSDFLDDVWFSYEAHFWLCGHVSSNNCVYWGTKVPDEALQRPLHSVKCRDLVAISKHRIIRQNADEEAVTVTKKHYIDVLNKFWRAFGTHRGVNWDVQWFQPDGTTPHKADITIDWFPNRLISRFRQPKWFSPSPDLNPLDFYLWGFLKDNMYENNP